MNTPTSLFDLQTLIQIAVQRNSSLHELANIILEKPPLSAHQRLKIYQDAYQTRLLESLRDDFSRVESALGEDAFNLAALNYIDHNPSDFRNLSEYSEGFLRFIEKTHSEFSRAAYTDWFEILSMHAQDPAQQVDPKEINNGVEFKIKIHPSTFFIELQGTFLVIYRNTNNIEAHELEEPLFRLFQFLQKERSPDEVAIFSDKNQFLEKVLLDTVHDWIQKKIIYCLPITGDNLC